MTRRLILLLLLLSASLAQAQRHYRVTNLGVLPGNTATVGYGLNDHGDVVGYCATGIQYTSDFREYPFVYRWAKISNFAPNGFYDYRTGVATGINNSGIICGYFYQPRQVPKPNIPYVDLAFVYDGNFKPLTDGHHSSFANAINNSGVVVGEYTPLDETLSTTNWVNDRYHPFTFANSQPGPWGTFKDIYVPFTILPQFDGNPQLDDSASIAINDRGQLAGMTSVLAAANGSGFTPEAWLYSNGSIQFLLPKIWWTVEGINNHGQVVGKTGARPDWQSAFALPISVAVTYQNGVLFRLTTPKNQVSSANAVNDAGQIVGSYYQFTPEAIAVLWLGNKAFNLNTLAVSPGVMLTNAVAINQAGQILCNGALNGTKRAFLLTPQ